MLIKDFKKLEPMKYYNNENNTQKRIDILANKNNEYIATEKHDGDWSMCIHYSKNNNLIRSRSISKITGEYGDYTSKLPHLCEEMDRWPDNTVILAELCFKEYGTNANTVGTILRCLPTKAIERQKTTPLYGFIFDVLMYNNQDLTNMPYCDRICYYGNFLRVGNNNFNAKYFYRTAIFYDGTDFQEAADEIISAGGEGIVIQHKYNSYMPGTRTAWKTLKLKQSLPHFDAQVVATIEPNKIYQGDCGDKWPYQINGECVTKPYYMGWKNGIVIKLPSGLTTDITSGLTDEDREYLASEEASQKIAVGELWAEIKAMSINDLGKLRHGSLVRLRTDLNSEGQ